MRFATFWRCLSSRPTSVLATHCSQLGHRSLFCQRNTAQRTVPSAEVLAAQLWNAVCRAAFLNRVAAKLQSSYAGGWWVGATCEPRCAQSVRALAAGFTSRRISAFSSFSSSVSSYKACGGATYPALLAPQPMEAVCSTTHEKAVFPPRRCLPRRQRGLSHAPAGCGTMAQLYYI